MRDYNFCLQAWHIPINTRISIVKLLRRVGCDKCIELYSYRDSVVPVNLVSALVATCALGVYFLFVCYFYIISNE